MKPKAHKPFRLYECTLYSKVKKKKKKVKTGVCVTKTQSRSIPLGRYIDQIRLKNHYFVLEAVIENQSTKFLYPTLVDIYQEHRLTLLV